MVDALIGFTGFVGSTLLKQKHFDAQYRSTNVNEIEHRAFDTVVCAGAPAQKWIANRDPERDQRQIEAMIAHLKTIRCSTFILISTVDVFKDPRGVNELTTVDETGLHAYGKNRRMLEKFVQDHFQEHLIIRLPGLVGPGLRKNVIYDFLNNNNLALIDNRAIFQFYPMVNLWYDIETIIASNLNSVHLTAEPISVSAIAKNAFGRVFDNQTLSAPAIYDMRTCHADVFGVSGLYQYSVRDTVQAARAYAQSEPIVRKSLGEES